MEPLVCLLVTCTTMTVIVIVCAIPKQKNIGSKKNNMTEMNTLTETGKPRSML